MQSRTVRGWVVVNGGGYAFVDTVARTRRDSILLYGSNESDMVYHKDRRKFGVQVVRCTITTEPKEEP